MLGNYPVFVKSHQLDLQSKRTILDQTHSFVQYTTVRVIFKFFIFIVVKKICIVRLTKRFFNKKIIFRLYYFVQKKIL